jgi:hypothetical protein
MFLSCTQTASPLQIQLLKGAEVEMPPSAQTFKVAPRAEPAPEGQPKLEL